MSDASSNPVPAGWSVTKLSHVVPVAQYGISSSLDAINGTPVLRMNNLNGGNIDVSSLKFSNSPEVERTLLQINDVLFNRTNSIDHVGRTSLWRGELPKASFASYLVRLIPDQHRLDPQFLVRWLNLPQVQIAIRCYATPGVHQVNINPTNLRRIEICLPDSLSRQRKIARILMTLDNVIAQTEALIAKYQAIKQGLMHDLFTRGVDATGKLRPPQSEAPELYKQSDLGWIPKGWEVCRVTDIASYQTGPPFPSAEYCDEGIHLLRPGNLTSDEYVRWDTAHTTFLPRDWQSKAAAFVVGEGEVVMNLTAQSLEDQFLGRVCITPGGTHCLLNQRLARFSATKCYLPFLFWAFKGPHFRYHIDRLTQGTKVQHIYNSNLNSALVAIPSSESEPELIADIMFSATRAVQNERQQLKVLRELKTGLMQDLLTGKVPVKADEPEEVTSHA